MIKPVVSVIVPTKRERKEYNDRILDLYLGQTYKEKFIDFDYGEVTIGEKRNRLCEKAKGEIILHMDSDDFYSPEWIEMSVEAIMESGADLVGLRDFYLLNEPNGVLWLYKYGNPAAQWVTGATFCYRRSFWEANKFEHKQIGEDISFVARCRKVFAHGYIQDFMATVHEGNTSKKILMNVRYSQADISVEEYMKSKFKLHL